MQPRIERIESLEALRAVAACMVLWGHALDYAGIRGDLSRSFAFGADLFFVLSGYIVSLSAERAGSALEFLRRRAWRILPLYYLATALEAARLWWRGDGFDLERFGKSLAFWRQEGGPVLAVGWTLNFEVLFYLWLALLIRWRPRDFRLWAALGPVALAVWNPITLLFAGGVLLRPLPAQFGVLGLLAWGVGGWVGVGDIWNCELTARGDNSGMRVMYWAFPAMAMVGAAAGFGCKKMPTWLLYLGHQSYPIYLFQHFGLMATAALGWWPGALGLAVGALAVSLAMSAGIASMWSKYVARVEFGLRRPARLGG